MESFAWLFIALAVVVILGGIFTAWEAIKRASAASSAVSLERLEERHARGELSDGEYERLRDALTRLRRS